MESLCLGVVSLRLGDDFVRSEVVSLRSGNESLRSGVESLRSGVVYLRVGLVIRLTFGG